MNKLLIVIALPEEIDDTARVRAAGRQVVDGTRRVVEDLIRMGTLKPGEMLVAAEPTLVLEMATHPQRKKPREEPHG